MGNPSKFIAGCFLCFTALLAGCGTSGPDTQIVKEVEAAGGGRASTVSPQAMRHWFYQHRPFATEIAKECAASPGRPQLGYSDTTEGKVCAAAADMRIQKAGRDGLSF